MEERLLQFIWQFQYFHKQQLQTTRGENLLIEKPGTLNAHQGPDFAEASIRIGKTRWVGNIELHIRSSDWHKHQHGKDCRYDNIILHVVWIDDEKVLDRLGNNLPTLVLQNRISRILLHRYQYLMETGTQLPCHSFLPALSALGWTSWKERLVAERLERKAVQIISFLKQTSNHWEEINWWMLAAGFGGKVNAVFFEQLAKTIPFSLLGKLKGQLCQIEALLFGQANLLVGMFTDAYGKELQNEYLFLQKKYRLPPVMGKPAFLRMRPAAFPTIRLAQLANLVSNSFLFFSDIRDQSRLESLISKLQVKTSEYWHTHYLFDEPAPRQTRQLGRQMAENILINTVIPLLFAYGKYHQEDVHRERSIQWLLELSPEENKLTKHWAAYGISHTTAFDSQAFIELTNLYCTQKRCLQCAVGNKILGS